MLEIWYQHQHISIFVNATDEIVQLQFSTSFWCKKAIILGWKQETLHQDDESQHREFKFSRTVITRMRKISFQAITNAKYLWNHKIKWVMKPECDWSMYCGLTWLATVCLNTLEIMYQGNPLVTVKCTFKSSKYVFIINANINCNCNWCVFYGTLLAKDQD